jgi:Tol biopolymer transport system component
LAVEPACRFSGLRRQAITLEAGMRSELVLFDLETATEAVVLAFDGLIEAPNWTPDGKVIVVNGGGRIFRVPLDAPDLVPVDTGFAVRCNNDHGVSPDGRLLAISDSTQDGESAIYTLPMGGGTPTRVTVNTPSYWHGWSPDGQTLAYAANRGDGFQIHTIPIAGGAEFQVTAGFAHCDGPDYSADGRWIWFNGERDGATQLWRVQPDGGALQKMTDDDRMNWFPHPSPDGRHVLFLAYQPGVLGHPFGKDVELRLMPADGGDPETLAEVHGGQGTLNVPCWAPDSRRFAFMRFDEGG